MASKVKDGLFISDCYASKDLDFVRLNKIFYMVNVAGGEVTNAFEGDAVGWRATYLSFPWRDTNDCTVFGEGDKEIKAIITFIDNALRNGSSVLVYSVFGNCRTAGN